ncbi:UNVERIFIED_ORG: DNA polymerase III alpha subunit [Shinella zoogloeoides]|nr:DNA polymerase III alpha subunit [Shinella zoogloeoides]
MFITIEDESGPANIVVWPTLFEKRRRVVLGFSMMAINRRIQREGEVVYLVSQQIFDLSGDLTGLADRDIDFKLPTWRDEVSGHRGGGPDSCDKPKLSATPSSANPSGNNQNLSGQICHRSIQESRLTISRRCADEKTARSSIFPWSAMQRSS